MKHFQYGLSAALVAGLMATAPVSAEPITPEMDAWMKAAKLGPYDKGKEDWADIVNGLL